MLINFWFMTFDYSPLLYCHYIHENCSFHNIWCFHFLWKFSKMSKYDVTGIGINLREVPDDNGAVKLKVLGIILDGPAHSAGVKQVMQFIWIFSLKMNICLIISRICHIYITDLEVNLASLDRSGSKIKLSWCYLIIS